MLYYHPTVVVYEEGFGEHIMGTTSTRTKILKEEEI